MISAMIGVPDADREMIREWTDESSPATPNPEDSAQAPEANGAYQYFYRLAIEKRERPGDDMTSLLAHAEFTDEDGESQRLTDAELVGFCVLSAAGNETVTKLLGNAIASSPAIR
jgi:cytochrome P450